MNINMTHALELAHYARNSAYELIDDALAEIAHQRNTHIDYLDCTATDAARAISADQLESAAFANSFLDAIFDDFMPMILIYELICHYIMNITNCTYDDICADY